MNEAATNGHLEILTWLYLKGGKFTSLAIDRAVMNGHFDIVKWLYSKGGKFTSDAIYYAKRNNNSEILEWVYDRLENRISTKEYIKECELYLSNL